MGRQKAGWRRILCRRGAGVLIDAEAKPWLRAGQVWLSHHQHLTYIALFLCCRPQTLKSLTSASLTHASYQPANNGETYLIHKTCLTLLGILTARTMNEFRLTLQELYFSIENQHITLLDDLVCVELRVQDRALAKQNACRGECEHQFVMLVDSSLQFIHSKGQMWCSECL